jgi:hypothetical protein
LEIQLSEVEVWDVINQFNSVTFISVLLLEIQLSEVEGWDVINQFDSATFISVLLLRDPVIRGRGLGCY